MRWLLDDEKGKGKSGWGKELYRIATGRGLVTESINR